MRKFLGYFSEFSIFGLVVLILIVGPLNFGSRSPVAEAWLEVAAACLFLFWMIRLLCLAEPTFVWTRVTLPLLCLFVYVFVRYLCCDVKWVARQEMLLWMCYTIIFLGVVNNLQRRWQVQALVWIIVIVASVEAADGMLRYYRGGLDTVCRFFLFDCTQRAGFQNLTRAGGTFLTPDHYAAYLVVALTIVVGHVIVLKRSWIPRLVMAYFGALILIGISLSKSRGGWIALVGAVLFFGFLIMRGKFLDFRSALVAFVVLAGVGYYLWTKHGLIAERMQDLIQHGEATREKLYLAALYMAKDHLFFGVGPQMYGWEFWKYEYNPSAPGFAHSEFLQVFADLGLVGVGLTGWLLVAFYRSALQMMAHRDASYTPYFSASVARRLAVAMGGAAAVFALTVHSMFDFVLHVMGVGVTFTTIVALMFSAAALRRKQSETDWDSFGFDRTYRSLPLTPRKQMLLMAGLGGCFLFFGFLTFNNFLSSFHYDKGVRQAYAESKPDLNEGIKSVELSLRFDSLNFKAAYELGNLYRHKSATDVALQTELIDKSFHWYGESIRLNPFFTEARQVRAEWLIELGAPDKARPDCEQMVHFSPYNPYYHLLYARVCLMQVDYKCARQHLEIASKLGDPAQDLSVVEAIRLLELIKDLPHPPQPD